MDSQMLRDTAGNPVLLRDTTGAIRFGAPPEDGGGPQLPAIGTHTMFTTYDGSDATCHPSVWDFGDKWNGYRFWLLDTPYVDPSHIPEEGKTGSWIENPCIWASNDRINFEAPPGVNNPLDGPPESGYYSDTELVFDGARLVATYRHSSGTLFTLTSPDGGAWTKQGGEHGPQGAANVSPTLLEVEPGLWRLWVFGDTNPPAYYDSDSPTGPWVFRGECAVTNMPRSLWHGDIIRWDDNTLIGVGSDRSGNSGIPIVSTDNGATWAAKPAQATLHGYRTTLLKSHDKPGYVESWNGRLGFNRPTWNLTPISAWL